MWTVKEGGHREASLPTSSSISFLMAGREGRTSGEAGRDRLLRLPASPPPQAFQRMLACNDMTLVSLYFLLNKKTCLFIAAFTSMEGGKGPIRRRRTDTWDGYRLLPVGPVCLCVHALA